MLRGIRPITVTVKSRKSLQLGWTNVPNQLANIGYCLRAASLLDSLLLAHINRIFFFVSCVPFHRVVCCFSPMQREEREREERKKDVELTEKSFQSKGKQCLSFGRVFAPTKAHTNTHAERLCFQFKKYTRWANALTLKHLNTPTHTRRALYCEPQHEWHKWIYIE